MPPLAPLRIALPLLIACFALSPPALASAQGEAPMTFVTLVTGFDQARQAEALIASIQTFAGRYRTAPIYVVVDNPDHVPVEDLRGAGVHLLALEIDEAARSLPFGGKAYAASQAERLLAGREGTLVWLDPEVLVLAPPRHLDLDRRRAVALRPVQLVNSVGQPPEAPIDSFWRGVYGATGVDPDSVPAVETVVDATRLRFYVNCQVIAWRLGRHIGPRWAAALSSLARDRTFLAAHAGNPLHRVFLHQAVLSGVLLASTVEKERRWLPIDHGYPLNLHDRLPVAARAPALDGLACVIVDSLWRQRNDWLSVIPSSESLRGWLEKSWRRTHEITPELLRQEEQCNTYLVRTSAGDVVIDPGGAPRLSSALRRLHGGRALLAVLLTHGHPDHRAGISTWVGDRAVPIIAQRQHAELLAEQDRIAALLARRSAIIAGTPMPPAASAAAPTPVQPTEFFDQHHVIEAGGVRIEMIHTPSETPDTTTIWIPSLRAAVVADTFYSSFPNLSTPRGGRTRSALDYVRALDVALSLEPELLLPGHEEPIFGRDAVRRRLQTYRDAVAWVHDAVVRGINEGVGVRALMGDLALPDDLVLPERFGRVSWSVRGLYELYAGWFDGQPESLYALADSTAAAELAALAGADAVVERAQDLLASGDAVRALHLTRAVLAVAPAHSGAVAVRLAALRNLLAASRNYFERGLLQHAIREVDAPRGPSAATPEAW